jgi:hypothetical protein
MSDDDFIERVEKSHERWTGEQWSPEKTLENFPLYGRAKRIAALEQSDQALREEAERGSLPRYTRLARLHTDLENIHQKLVKVGR